MIEGVLGGLVSFVTDFISTTGYIGILVTMAADAFNIPLPSELVLGFTGYLVSTGRFNLWWAVLFASLGSTLGSIASYWLGRWGGRPFIERYGKFVLVTRRDLATADRLFKKYGDAIAFFSRVIPLLRTFISLPAGVARMDFKRFALFTFIGSVPWSLLVIYIGQLVGENYSVIQERFDGAEYVVLIGLVLAIIAWVARFIREQIIIHREQRQQKKRA
jgi:membrane protein DedA with SNARE-associated domain